MLDKEIRILLDKAQTYVYSPSDAVSGTLVFVPAFNCKIKCLKFGLRGECYVSSIGANSKVSKQVLLFATSSNMLENTYTHMEHIYELPFSFMFPARSTSSSRAGPSAFRTVFDQDEQLLPDSFTLSVKNLLQCVRYFLHLEIIGRKFKPKECTILFRQPKDIRVLHPRTMVQSLPTQISLVREYRFKSRAKVGAWLLPFNFNRKRPKLAFTPCIHAPTSVVVGQPIALSLAIDTSTGRKSPNATTLLLQDLSVSITAHTRIIGQVLPSKRRYGRCFELSYTVLDAKELNVPVVVDGASIPLTQDFRTFPGALASFKTYTISRDYTLDVAFTLRYDAEPFQWEKSTALEILEAPDSEFVDGKNLDPLIFLEPRKSPKTHWRNHIEAGGAEGTGRAEHPPDVRGSM